ncbi:hypothetical protein [Polaribacter sp. Hel_I_88]|uniref:hypothetical protein n=1 Tax=Polaribacter sp. Hel_I_88 TaxID=1250006 RepID=UPI0004791FD9|nr:hypothetical protein [Polaribacter sp. Hel_I_88]
MKLNNGSNFLICFVLMLFIVSCNSSQKTLYSKENLVLTKNRLSDGLGSFSVKDLPNVTPKTNLRLVDGATPIMAKMFNIAVHDIEQNIVTNEYGSYFAAGRRYTDRVYTRDIAFAGILGLNALFPEKMKQSLKITREVRGKLGYKVSEEHVVTEINVPWDAITKDEKKIMAQYKTNSYTRRTDDVVWIWAVDHLFELNPEFADWAWFYETGKENFERFYEPWFDASDGLYRGQPTFQDITSTAYPKNMSIADCVLLKSTSTNAMYYKAMLAMANAAKKNNLFDEAKTWENKAINLKKAIKKELVLPDGTLTYYKDRNGHLMKNQHNLGTAFTILFGILEGDDAKKAIDLYPMTDKGTPLIHPFLEDNEGDHNRASWPFCDTFFIQAKEITDQKDYTGYNAAILARTLGTKISDKRKKNWGGFGSFHEKVELPGGLISGSGQQLWTSAAFINICLRANLINLKTKP